MSSNIIDTTQCSCMYSYPHHQNHRDQWHQVFIKNEIWLNLNLVKVNPCSGNFGREECIVFTATNLGLHIMVLPNFVAWWTKFWYQQTENSLLSHYHWRVTDVKSLRIDITLHRLVYRFKIQSTRRVSNRRKISYLPTSFAVRYRNSDQLTILYNWFQDQRQHQFIGGLFDVCGLVHSSYMAVESPFFARLTSESDIWNIFDVHIFRSVS